METRATLRPRRQGTKKLLARFGERLIRARYRYDTERKKPFTTVEPIVDGTGWIPSVTNQTSSIAPTENPTATAIETPATAPTDRGDEPFWKAHELVGLRVEFEQAGLPQKAKAAGAKWNPQQRPWFLRRDRAIEFGLQARIATLTDEKKFMLCETCI